MSYNGRRKICTSEEVITRDNLLDILDEAMLTHASNRSEIQYLWDYYRGKTPIQSKTKEYRENINNIVNENRAMQIVEFYQGYIFGEPIQYIRRGKDETLNEEISWLNDKMAEKDKVALDNELAEWMLVAGVCPRMILPSDDDDSVFEIYTLDPRYSFNVYHNGLGEKVVMSVKCVTLDDSTEVISVYTKDTYFEVTAGEITKEEKHSMGCCPMVEYLLNNVRMGIFEPVLSIMDAIDTLQSNRIDDVEQFVNSILAILGGEINKETMDSLRELGALNLPEGVDAKYLNSVLAQGDIQTLKKDLLSAIIEITGMPNRNGGSSTSDTGSAVMLRDGWETADAKSKRIEVQFKKAEKKALGIIISIATTLKDDFNIGDVEIRFTRRNYENIQTKAQVLTQLLGCEKIAPELAFTHCGMFADPTLAYEISRKYVEEVARNAIIGD